jgi:GH25 family lysozyme M1 (1,4-beta-N-acetylmuramidase)
MADLDPLIVDVYSGDPIKGSWQTLANAGEPWDGAILHCTQGHVTSDEGWFLANWRALHAVKRANWFGGAYDYWIASDNDVAQAERFLTLIDAAGGWHENSLWPVIDVEHGGNDGVTKQRVIDGVSTWSAWILARTGRRPMLYGGSLLRDLGITDHMGCGLLWVARWAATLPPSTYEDIGWTRDRLWGWQYIGSPSGGSPVPAGYPTTTPIGQLDTTAMVIDDAKGSAAPLAWVKPRLGSLLE